jgi:cytochrome c5
VLQTPVTTLAGSSADDGQPAVDGNGAEFLVAHARKEPTGSMRDVRCMRVEFAAGALAVGPDLAIEATPNEDEFGPDIAWLGPKYCVAFVERPASSLQDDVGAWLVDSSCTVCNARITLPGVNASVGANREWAPRVAGRWPFALNGFNDDGLVVFAEALDVPPFAGSIAAQRVEALGPGLPPVHLGGACGNGGTPVITAPFVVGSAGFHFRATGLEPAATVLLSLGLPGPTLTCGGCALLSPVTADFVANLSGTATRSFSIPCDPAFVGFVLEFQWVSLLTSANPCPAVAGLSASERVRLTLGP